MKIKEICERTGLTDRTVRFYIEEQLIHPFYTENYLGRKSFDFSEQDLERLREIATLRAFGFSIEEIKQLAKGEQGSEAIVEAVRARTGENLDESRRRLQALSALDPVGRADLSELARRLAAGNDPSVENEAKGIPWRKRLISVLRACGAFLAVWLPIASVLVVLSRRLATFSVPVIRPVFLVCALLCLLPSMVTVLVSQRMKGNGRILRVALTVLCVLCLPVGVMCSVRGVTVCEHRYEEYRMTREATCEREGETILKCKECGALDTQTVPKRPHAAVVWKGVKPTCTENGTSDGATCSLCHAVLTEQTVLPATNIHTPTMDEAVPASCVKSGLTEGSHCSVCGVTLIEQKEIPTEPHAYQRRQIPQSCGVDGCIIYECACGDSYRTDILPATNLHDFRSNPQVMGYTCHACGLNVVSYGNADGSLSGGNNRVKYYVTGNPVLERDYRIVVYGSGEMPDFEKTGNLPAWDVYLSETVEVTIGEGITSIGAYSFYCPEPHQSCEFFISDTVRTIKSNAISLKIKNLVLGDGVEQIDFNRFDTTYSLYIPKSLQRVDIDALLGVDAWFYEGTLSEFYTIQVSAYGTNMSMKAFLEGLDENIISNIHLYVEATDLSDRSHYWR